MEHRALVLACKRRCSVWAALGAARAVVRRAIAARPGRPAMRAGHHPCLPGHGRLLFTVRASAGACPTAQEEARCSERDASAPRTLVSGVLAAWPADHPYPLATIRASLGQAGCIEVETKAMLEMEGVADAPFGPEVRTCLWPLASFGRRVTRQVCSCVPVGDTKHSVDTAYFCPQ